MFSSSASTTAKPAASTTTKPYAGGTSSFKLGGTSGSFGASKTHYQAQLTQDPLFSRVFAIRSALNPSSVGYKFGYVFYDKKTPGSDLPKRPNNIGLNDWVKIMQKCPDPEHLVPVQLCGFAQLEERVKAQKEIEKELSKRMKLVQAKLREMTSFYATELSGLLERIEQNTLIISQLTMDVIEVREVQRGQGVNLSPKETEMLNKLEDLRLDLNKPNLYSSAISNLRIKSEMMQKKTQSRPKMSVDKETLRSVATVLRRNQDAIEALETATKRAKRSVEALEANIDNKN